MSMQPKHYAPRPLNRASFERGGGRGGLASAPPPPLVFVHQNVSQHAGGGGGKFFLIPGGIFFFGVTPPRGGGGYEKKWVLQKKLFRPMSHLLNIITVFPPHNMPLLLVGIPLFGSLGY